MTKIEKMIAALTIMAKYESGIIGADHDIIYGVAIDTVMDTNDIAELKRLGWRPSSEFDSFVLNV